MARSTLLQLAVICLLSLIGLSSANDAVCQESLYKDLLFLADYAPAESFCTKYYPVPTITVTVAAANRRGLRRRATSTTSAVTTSAAVTSAAPTASATSSSRNKNVVWASCVAQGVKFVGQLCSCIEVTPTITVKVNNIKVSRWLGVLLTT